MNINSAANNVPLEQRCTMTDIKREWFDMKLDAKNYFLKPSAVGLRWEAVQEMGQLWTWTRKSDTVGDVTLGPA